MKVKVASLVLDPALEIRSGLHEDAVERYRELYESGSGKAIVVDKDTLRVIDGRHRLEAARRAGITEVYVEQCTLPEHALLAEALRRNLGHGVPLCRMERNAVIRRLYRESGLTQAQIATMVRLSQQAISKILNVGDTTGGDADKRIKLTDDRMPAVARLLLGGAPQDEVAKSFGVARTTITTRWSDYRDQVKAAYESELLKHEVATKFGLAADEIDQVLRSYDPEPLNFTPQDGSLWSGFRIDERFGQRHAGNLPAELVRNLLYYHSRPGQVIIDPCAGGGVVLDVCRDMVGRMAYGFDLNPVRDDINKWDILTGPPPIPVAPDVVLLDPPWAGMLEGRYLSHPSQLGDMEAAEFVAHMAEIFAYWERGTLILVMGCLQRAGQFVALPHQCAKLMEQAGWRISGWLVNEIHRPSSETGITVAQMRKSRLTRRTHVDIVVATK